MASPPSDPPGQPSIHRPQWKGTTPRQLLVEWLEGTAYVTATSAARNYGPTVYRLHPDLETFCALVDPIPCPRAAEGFLPCWLFRSADALWDYATYVRPSGAGRVTAHLWLYEILHGKIPEGLKVDHTCETKRCVNPDHLEAVTQSENVKRAQSRKRGRNL